MKKALTLGLASLCALSLAHSTFAIQMTGNTQEVPADYNISATYTVTIPAAITFSAANTSVEDIIKAENVLIESGETLEISMSSANGKLKNESSFINYGFTLGDDEEVAISSGIEYELLSVRAGNTSGAEEDIVFTAKGLENVTLAGMHSDTLTFKIAVIFPLMQDIDAVMKADIASGEITSLKDGRDNRVYTVAEIAGKTWMTSDLAYVPEDYTNWDTDGIYIDEESGGVYYKWAVANNGNTCPEGWKVPSKDDFGLLTALFDKDTIKSGPFKGVFYGYVNSNGSFVRPNSFLSSGYYWSTIEYYHPEYGDYAYVLALSTGSFISTGLSSTTTTPQKSGNSIRCIAE